MIRNQKNISKIYCPNCGKSMKLLKESVSPIYICSYCGKSIELNNVNQKRFRNKDAIIKNKNLLEYLFSKNFMNKYTDFDSFNEFIKNCDFIDDSVEKLSQESFKHCRRKLNRYVRKHTCFSSWDKMFEKATNRYLKITQYTI